MLSPLTPPAKAGLAGHVPVKESRTCQGCGYPSIETTIGNVSGKGRTMYPGRRPTARGFTLLEVIVALAILGIGLTLIIELFSGGLRLGRASEDYTKAVNYASSKMQEIMTQDNVEEGTGEGEFDDRFRWQVEAKKVDILPGEKSTEFKPPVELYKLTIDVLWKSGSKERSARLETYRTIKLGTDDKKS
jgi:general secretion pathway protein I